MRTTSQNTIPVKINNPVKDRRFTIGVFNRHGRPTEADWLFGFVTSGFFGFWKGGVDYS
jgi:hypothetical protein